MKRHRRQTPRCFHLVLVARARHPALQEAEGANDFVLLGLRLGGAAVAIERLLLNPVSRGIRIASISAVFAAWMALCAAPLAGSPRRDSLHKRTPSEGVEKARG